MLFSDSHILSTILFTPLVGAILMLFIPRTNANAHRLMGNLFGLLGLAVSLPLLWRFKFGAPDFQFQQRLDWIPSINAHYFLGIDGISFLMVMLTTVLGAIAILSSWSAIHKREKEYYILLLLLQTGMLGVFMSLDFVLFYVFWEVMLVPMYFLIGVWGSERRLYAAIKFFLYTLAGSVVMLLAILMIYFKVNTFDIREILMSPHAMFARDLQNWLFWGFFFAFAIKVPMFPFHTWLPDAHTEAPTAGSVILAGVLLKMGTYGFLRFSVPMFPDATMKFRWIMIVLSLIGIIYGALVCMMQKDMKKLIAYSSVSHMGFLHSGNFRAHAAWPFRKHHPAGQSRNFDRRAVLDRRCALRTAPHAPDFGIRRARHTDAEFCSSLFDCDAQLPRHAPAKWLHRRIHHSSRRVRSALAVGGVGRNWRSSRRCVSSVALSARNVRQHH